MADEKVKEEKKGKPAEVAAAKPAPGRAILVGHGRVGSVISAALLAKGVPLVVVDADEATIDPLRAKGVVHRVQPGDYLGRNNGQIADITPQHVDVFEVISDGRGGWLERTLTISLKQQS